MARSVQDLLSFLEQQVEAGVLRPATAYSRKSSIAQMARVLNAAEAADVTVVDIDMVADRFFKQSNHNYSIASRISYKSRFQSAVEEFRTYLIAPDKLHETNRPRSSFLQMTRAGGNKLPTKQVANIPISIRDGWIVHIENVPVDLTTVEAERIAGVLQAYAVQGP